MATTLDGCVDHITDADINLFGSLFVVQSCDSKEEQREFEKLHEENERLRNKQTIIEAQLMEVFTLYRHAHLSIHVYA